jgi:hypothetical protein
VGTDPHATQPDDKVLLIKSLDIQMTEDKSEFFVSPGMSYRQVIQLLENLESASHSKLGTFDGASVLEAQMWQDVYHGRFVDLIN